LFRKKVTHHTHNLTTPVTDLYATKNHDLSFSLSFNGTINALSLSFCLSLVAQIPSLSHFRLSLVSFSLSVSRQTTLPFLIPPTLSCDGLSLCRIPLSPLDLTPFRPDFHLPVPKSTRFSPRSRLLSPVLSPSRPCDGYPVKP
jgi:hypothetical protein